MRVLDWRSWPERRLTAAGMPAPAWLVDQAGRVADALVARRAARRSPPPTDVLVVSIGNLRLGGTGKTPVTLALARGLIEAGIDTGAILLRGHGSRATAPLLVSPADPDAGDEARLLAAGLADSRWRVLQARRREAGLAALLAMPQRPRVILLEDGLQTANVGRHLDVVILDRWTVKHGTVVPGHGPVVPFGPYRETGRGARRAAVWLLEGEDVEVGWAAGAGTVGSIVLGFTRSRALAACHEAAPADTGPATSEVWGVISGVARPEGVERAAGSLLATPPVLAVRVADHARYDQAMLARILAAGRRAGVTAWVTTAKDWVKLGPSWPRGVPAVLIVEDVQWRGSQALPQMVASRLAALGSPSAMR